MHLYFITEKKHYNTRARVKKQQMFQAILKNKQMKRCYVKIVRLSPAQIKQHYLMPVEIFDDKKQYSLRTRSMKQMTVNENKSLKTKSKPKMNINCAWGNLKKKKQTKQLTKTI